MKVFVSELPKDCNNCIFWVKLPVYNHGTWCKTAYEGCVLGKKSNQSPDDFEKPVDCPLAKRKAIFKLRLKKHM